MVAMEVKLHTMILTTMHFCDSFPIHPESPNSNVVAVNSYRINLRNYLCLSNWERLDSPISCITLDAQ